MTLFTRLRSLASLALLERTRTLLRSRRGHLIAAAIAAVYALTSMILGGMLQFYGSGSTGTPWVATVINVPGSSQWWDYPEFYLEGPGGLLALPFLPTLTMVLVAIGVGIGGAAVILLVLPLLRSAGPGRRTAATSAAAGASPAITGLATLGACCTCSTCIGAGGVAVVAAASGANLYTLLWSNWYIDVFQLVVVWISLLIEERGLAPSRSGAPREGPPPLDLRFGAGALLRVGLLVAGITWSLAMLVEWSLEPPLAASAATWYHWIFEHQLLAGVAVVAGLFPRELRDVGRSLGRRLSRIGGLALPRVVMAVAAITWGIAVPPFLVQLGLGGFLNELLGFLGYASPWSVPPDSPLGAALLFHWIFQHLLLAGFTLVLACSPRLAMTPLLWTVSNEGRPSSTSVERAQDTVAPGEAS